MPKKIHRNQSIKSSSGAVCLLLLVSLASPFSAAADKIAIIGTGDVGGALGPRFADLGHEVVYGSRNPSSEKAKALAAGTRMGLVKKPEEAAVDADIVVLAVPAGVVVDVALALGDLSGKVVIDPTNAFSFTGDQLVVANTDEAVGVTLQRALPGAHVVKAFNLLSYRVMVDPELAGGRMTIPLVGDNAEAKAQVAKLAERLGFDALDLGPMRYAREQEGLLILWFNARLAGKPFNYYLRPEKKPGNDQ